MNHRMYIRGRPGLKLLGLGAALIVVLLFSLITASIAAPPAPDVLSGPHSVRQVARVDAGWLPAPDAPMGKSTLGDYVWYDANVDGDHLGGEAEYLAGINGVLVNLYHDLNFNGVIDAGEFEASMYTGDNPDTTETETGWYSFDVTADGNQWIVEIDPSNFLPGGPLYGYILTSGNVYGPTPLVVFLPNLIQDYPDADFGFVAAGIDLVKTAGNAADGAVEYLDGPPPKPVTYYYAVTNTGQVPLALQKSGSTGTYRVTDDKCSPLSYVSGDANNNNRLDPGETWNYTCTYTVNTNDPVTNVATARGNPIFPVTGGDIPYAPDQVDTDDAAVDIVNPAIDVVKIAGNAPDGTVEYLQGPPPKQVVYTYTVKNTGDTYLYLDKSGTNPTYKLTDDKCSPLVYQSGDTGNDGLLAPGETWTFTCTATINTNDPVTNTATVRGNPTDPNGNDLPDINDATDTDQAVVDIVNPAIDLVKTAGNAADGQVEYLNGPPPKQVTYTYTVTNTGDTPIYVDKTGTDPTYRLTDNKCSPVQYQSGDTDNDGLLDTNETWTFTCTATIDTNDPVVNTATVRGNPTDGAGNNLPDINDVTDTDDAVVDIVNPAIDLVKTAGNAPDGTVEYLQGPPPKQVVYTYTVKNTGDTYLYLDKSGTNPTYKLTDDKCSPLTYQSGDTGNDGLLAPGETWTFTCIATINTNDPVTNTATVRGQPTDSAGNGLPGINDATDTDQAVVDIVNPAIDLVKTAGNAADGATYYVAGPPPKQVTYTYTVKNTGDTPIYVDKTGANPTYRLTDDKCSPVTYQSGDLDNDGLLDTNETWTFTCVHTLTNTDLVINLATVRGNPTDGNGNDLPDINDVTDTDDARAQIITGSILVEKTPDLQYAAVGSTVTFNIVVTNNGQVPLTNVSVSDTLAPNCDRAAGTIPLLLPNQSFSYSCTFGPVTGDLNNVATATGQPSDNQGVPLPNTPPVTDDDNAFVDAVNPGIQLVKTAGPSTANQTPDGQTYFIPAPGGVVYYRFVVSNTGDTNLINVSVVDNVLGYICGPFTLPIGQSTTCYAPATYASQDVTNTGTAQGQPATPNYQPIPGVGPISDDDDAVVDVYRAAYTVEKTLVTPASPNPARPGELVQFRIRVRNTGDVYLGIVPLVDTYDTLYLQYGYTGSYSVPASDDNLNDGTLNWTDLTAPSPYGFNMDLAPDSFFDVFINFTAIADTTLLPNQVTLNTARVQGARPDLDGPTGPRPPETTPLPPQESSAPVKIMSPTGVTLAGYGVTAADGGALVAWETANESNIVGFNVLRKAGGEAVAVNAELIFAEHAGAARGAAYSLADNSAPAGTCTYVLEVLHLDGSSSRVELGEITF